MQAETPTYQGYRTESDEPHIAQLSAELKAVITDSTEVIERMLTADNTLYAVWSDQQDDGRKPELVDGREAEPWPGSSDVRLRLADELVNDQVRLMAAAARRARFALQATQGRSLEQAGKVQSYLQWLRSCRMRRNVRRETRLGARWRQVYGSAAMSITWHQEWAREYQEVTLEQLAAAAQADPAGVAAQLMASLYEPDADVLTQLAELLRRMYPDLDLSGAKEQLRALQKEGRMQLPARYLRRNEPVWKASKWFVDAFVPLNTGSVQEAPWYIRRVVLTPQQVLERNVSEEWDEEFCKAVVQAQGRSILDWAAQKTAEQGRRQVFQDSAELMKGLCEVCYAYYRTVDEHGVPCIHLTVFSPHVAVGQDGQPIWGLDQPYGYEHGDLPVVELVREHEEEQLFESRGVPETVITQQWEAKAMRDARVNQTELFLQPPVIRPEREIGLSLTIRPRGEIGERRAQSTRQWSVPNTAPAGQPLELDALHDAFRYHARNRAEEPVRAQLYDEDLVESWLGELEDCWSMTLKLAQQYENEVTFDRVVGGQLQNIRLTREEIQGEYTYRLLFSPDQLNPELIESKVKSLAPVLQSLDRGAVIDWAPTVRGLFQYVLPEFADESLRTGDQATAAEVHDEQVNWALMLSGTEPEMHENGQNFALRLQWLEQQLQQPTSQQRLAQAPGAGDIVQRRLQHLRFQVQQYQVNAQTGRVGVETPQPARVP